MRTIGLSGSASGIGAAIRARLTADGHRVVGVDIRQADVVADLSTGDGRTAAAQGVQDACEGRLDGFVACAGLGPQHEPRSQIVAVNYFGAVAMLDALRPCLAAGTRPAAVAIASNSATITPGADLPLVGACLDGNEVHAQALAGEHQGSHVYAATKLALARWVRRHAVGEAWAGAGVRLNAVAPGAVDTPLLQGGLDDPTLGPAIRSLPIPLGRGRPEQIAGVVAFLLSDEAAALCGSVVYADGGSDALIRPDAF